MRYVQWEVEHGMTLAPVQYLMKPRLSTKIASKRTSWRPILMRMADHAMGDSMVIWSLAACYLMTFLYISMKFPHVPLFPIIV